ncbi:MAG: hypothetical protein IPM83_08940 [Ignavibacteria bacterium]|nr:hypothetical protein [Ignavibacteria bacterium]
MKLQSINIVLCLAIVALTTPSLQGQIRQPERLPNLLWVRDANGNMPVGGEMMFELPQANAQNPTPIIQDFVVGWNWTRLFRPAQEILRTRRLHVPDYRDEAENAPFRHLRIMQDVLLREGVPNLQLIPAVKGISQAEEDIDQLDTDVNWSEERPGTNPSEAVAMEFSPWLNHIVNTNRFELRTDDVSGGVFGWASRQGGTVQNENGTYRMRYTRGVAGDNTDPIVLQDARPNDMLRGWAPPRTPYGFDRFDVQNTFIMELSITIRRTEDDPAAGNPTDPVLTITLPYGLGVEGVNTHLIRFNAIPQLPITWQNWNDLNNNLIARIPEFFVDVNVEEFVITKEMLPPMTDPNREVTLIARFECRPNPNNDAWINPLLRRNDGNTADADRIGRMSISVRHHDDGDLGLGVDIRNIRLQTPLAGRLFTGQEDERIQHSANRYLQDLRTMQNNLGGTNNPPTYQVWQFYGRDEGPRRYWKSYRYINALLGGRLMTEVGMEDPEDFRHCTQPLVLWQGATFTTPPQLASYSVRRGYNVAWQTLPPLPTTPPPTDVERAAHDAAIVGIIHRFAGIRYGLFDMRSQTMGGGLLLLHDDPDTYLDWRPMADINGVLRPDTLPIRPTEDIDLYLQANPGGILANLERVLRLDYAAHPHMLFGTTPWLGQVWLNFHMQVRGHAAHFASFLNNRPRSMTEARVALWLPVMLGAKGLMLYRGQTSREGDGAPFPVFPVDFHDIIDDTDPGSDNLENGLMGWFDPNGAPPPFPVDMQARRAWFLSDQAGVDWLEDNDPTNVAAYFRPDIQTVRTSLNDNDPNNARLWIGTRSLTNVSVEVLDRLHAMRTVLGRATNGRTDADPHILTQLRLEGWYGHGFTEINVARVSPSPLGSFVDLGNVAGRLRTRHPNRKRDVFIASGIPGHFDYEVFDSTFIDVTAFSLPNDRTMTSSAVIGLMNRRTDPRMLPPGAAFQNSNSSNWNNVSYDEWQARGPAERYGQRGAREVTLPFNYSHADGRYRLLRIREMGGGIDTVIGQDRELAMLLLPGEGKMFQVDVLMADDAVRTNSQDISRGFLDHNTQRKLVHFPQITGWQMHTEPKPQCGSNSAECQPRTYMRTTNGATMRYHLVYHRRSNPNLPFSAGNPLDVFYQRSTAMPIRCAGEDDCVDLGAIQWENPITINSYIVDTIIGTDTTMINPLNRPSCGYPSVVVRYDRSITPARSRVYVVYSCEEDNPALRDVVIYEAQLDADIPWELQANNYTRNEGRSRRLGRAQSGGSCAAFERLRYWGTPVVNASNSGNFYAWSCHADGIVYGYKLPPQRTFIPINFKKMKVTNGAGTKVDRTGKLTP